ncbi:hypothetical protein NMY22_g9338 [Coprinellus aureogranulatus]|nr:hypothetical protein NMY22_g9338 [Coprinellus aureogranulatus]
MDSATLAAIVELGYAQQHVTYVEIASIVLLTVEIVHSLPDEVELIWRAEWNAGKILFLLSRYLPFSDVTLDLLYATTTANSIELCQKTFASGSGGSHLILNVRVDRLTGVFRGVALTLIGVVLAEVILYLRVYALSGGSQWVGVLLGVLFVALHGTTFVFLIRFIKSLEYSLSPLPKVIGCLPIKGSPKDLSIVFVLIMASELAILAITIWTLLSKFRQSKNQLVSIFYRDGVVYFLLLTGTHPNASSNPDPYPALAISGGNIICNLVAPPGYTYLLACLQRVLHSILATRMVLHIRKVHKKKYEASAGGGIPLSQMGYAVQVNVRVEESVNFPQESSTGTVGRVENWEDDRADVKRSPHAF